MLMRPNIDFFPKSTSETIFYRLQNFHLERLTGVPEVNYDFFIGRYRIFENKS